ncbi:hypothetical protein [Microbacterium sp. CH12i]|uniref:hypothetical protein n=1 Tax=Microbacterium sp. CH12i TaxID=1479651 RepID=UPI001267ABD8|nr:hypothetical protein [Microbacterium sp. CH12i]
MKRQGLWVVTSVVVVGLALTGAVVASIYSAHRSAPTQITATEPEKGNTPASRDLETGEPSAPAPPTPPLVVDESVVKRPEVTKPRLPTSGSEDQSPHSARPEPGTPGGLRPETPGPGSGLGTSTPATGIVLGDTTDEAGNDHSLVLKLPEETQDALLRTDGIFAVVSGASRLSVTGDVAAERWRFIVDSTVIGAKAPIVVVKTMTNRTMHDLASAPDVYTSASGLNEDPRGISIRLTALITEVLSNAEPSQPDSHLYMALAQMMLDPNWTGVMVFNATATVPSEVLGQSTGALADSPVAVLNMGFTASIMSEGPESPRPFFGTVDQSRVRGDVLPLGVEHLRARFSNSAMVAFEQG